MNKAENSKCLLLNANYCPLKIISWQKAIVWSLKYNENHNYAIQIIDYYSDKYIQGTNKTYPVPSVAKTVKYFNLYDRSLKFSRKNLFIRDNYTCQYCGESFPYNQLTYDHVIPKSKFIHDKHKATSWSNIITACTLCNRKKKNKTPEQANMELLSFPYQPKYDFRYLPVSAQLSTIGVDIPSAWKNYLLEYHNA